MISIIGIPAALVFLATSQVVQFAEQIARRAEPH
jgi:hypothetical protein